MICYEEDSQAEIESQVEKTAADFIHNMESLANYAYNARLGEALHKLVYNVQTLILHADFEEAEFRITAYDQSTGQRKLGVAADPLDAILAVFSRERTKTCKTCGYTKTLRQFSRSQSTADKFNRYCKDCECERSKRNYYERKARKTLRFRLCIVCKQIKPAETFQGINNSMRGTCNECSDSPAQSELQFM